MSSPDNLIELLSYLNEDGNLLQKIYNIRLSEDDIKQLETEGNILKFERYFIVRIATYIQVFNTYYWKLDEVNKLISNGKILKAVKDNAYLYICKDGDIEKITGKILVNTENNSHSIEFDKSSLVQLIRQPKKERYIRFYLSDEQKDAMAYFDDADDKFKIYLKSF